MSKAEILRLELIENELSGELALPLAPGTTAPARDKALDALLSARLAELAKQEGVVVIAAASAFAHPRDGKDEEGRTRFDLRGRLEGDMLVPVRARGAKKER